ncbi:MAG TPA: transposase [Hyphomicrobiaceae bacterium]|nr:transposase [Hyphomicrobiaceae bacterium]
MATQRRYLIEFKRQIVQEYQAGETLHGLAKRHGISRNLAGPLCAFGEPYSSLDEREQVRIDHIRMRRERTVGIPVVELQRTLLK